ncbi:MAG: MMPL family transporter [Acidimicrobiia bacterium]|nr:MMPL family transporter [Acidimicrobiia bacterium]
MDTCPTRHTAIRKIPTESGGIRYRPPERPTAGPPVHPSIRPPLPGGTRILELLARTAVRRRRGVLASTAVAFVVAAVVGSGAPGRLVDGGFNDDSSESSRAAALISEKFATREPNLVLLVTASRGDVDDPAVAAAGRAVTEELAGEDGISDVVSYWSLASAPPLRSTDGRSALVLAVVNHRDDGGRERLAALSDRYTRMSGGQVSVAVTGAAEIFRQLNGQIKQDLARAELIAFPVTLVLLVVVFGSLVAAVLPLAVGALAIAGSLFMLYVIASLTDVSIFALNLATMMGLGLAIDYSLFIVSRFREELRRGLDPHTAVERTVVTAGRTIVFSAFTVAISISALLVFPLAFLRSFAYAGIAVAITAAAGATIFLPALLAVLGTRVDRLAVRRRTVERDGGGTWHRVATLVMRRPVPIAFAVIVLLLALGTPFLRIQFGVPDDRVLPPHLSSRAAMDAIREGFESRETGALQVVAADLGDPSSHSDEIDAYALRLSRLDGVSRVDSLTGVYTDGTATHADDLPPGDLRDAIVEMGARFDGDDSTWLSVVPSVEPMSPEGEALARAVRGVDAPFETLVTGGSAELVDAKASLFARLPLAGGLIALATFVLLFLLFGSVVVPLKALALNVLSLSAMLGALVWIFQDGHFAGLLGFTPTGTIAVSMPILLFCVAFGISMDYEVFLLSRIKEEYDHTGDNAAAVAVGLERTGGIVTAAAVLISVVNAAFATSGVAFVKLMGIGMTFAVLVDAFVIRATLVPAFMRIAGAANWWAPPILRRVHARIGIREAGPPPASLPLGEAAEAPARAAP